MCGFRLKSGRLSEQLRRAEDEGKQRRSDRPEAARNVISA